MFYNHLLLKKEPPVHMLNKAKKLRNVAVYTNDSSNKTIIKHIAKDKKIEYKKELIS